MAVDTKGGRFTQAQASLLGALESLLSEKPLASIDVKRLCEHAHVARTTFYAYYRNTDELMEQLEDIHVSKISSLNAWVASQAEFDAESVAGYEATLEYVRGNRAFFYAELVTHHNGRLAEKWKTAIKEHLAARFKVDAASSHNLEFILEVASSAVIAAYVYWLKNPSAVSKGDVFSMIELALGVMPMAVR